MRCDVISKPPSAMPGEVDKRIAGLMTIRDHLNYVCGARSPTYADASPYSRRKLEIDQSQIAYSVSAADAYWPLVYAGRLFIFPNVASFTPSHETARSRSTAASV